jgi:hemerythrin-like domain-containing protein
MLLFSFIVSNRVISQGHRGEKQGQDFKKRFDRIEELKKLKMLEELNLSEDASQKFLSRYVNFRKQWRQLEKERSELLNDLEALLKATENEPDLSKKIEEIESVDQKMFDNRKIFIQDLKKIIQTEKTAHYLLFERNFQREIQNILRDLQKQRFRPR